MASSTIDQHSGVGEEMETQLTQHGLREWSTYLLEEQPMGNVVCSQEGGH